MKLRNARIKRYEKEREKDEAQRKEEAARQERDRARISKS